MEKADIESIPIKETFDLKDEKDAYDAAENGTNWILQRKKRV